MKLAVAKLLNFLVLVVFFQPFFATSQTLTKKQTEALDKLVRQSPVFSRMFTGFALYDPATQKSLYQKDADKYYTPASNTKLFTLYTSLKVLGDSLPVLRYLEWEGHTIFQGLGYPLLLHPEFADRQDPRIWRWLQSVPGPLAFSSENFVDGRFGLGWDWSDYGFTYQLEKAALPLYGNIIQFARDSGQGDWRSSPSYARRRLTYDPQLPNAQPQVTRGEFETGYRYNLAAVQAPRVRAALPARWDATWVAELLSDTLERPVMPWVGTLPQSGSRAFEVWRALPDSLQRVAAVPPLWRTLATPLTDTLLRLFMQESDNFLAEQLLLMAAAKQLGWLNVEAAIGYANQNLFKDLPDAPIWTDGSGLSRQNLFTPRTIVTLLDKLYREYTPQRIMGLLPAGGVSGTIRNWYRGRNGVPYVFAKTGTLANNHCLSGYLVTSRGRILIFSFMHNHFSGSATPVRQEMQKVLEWLRDNL